MAKQKNVKDLLLETIRIGNFMLNQSKKFVGEFTLKNPNILKNNFDVNISPLDINSLFQVENLLSKKEVAHFISEVKNAPFLPVGTDGFLNNYKIGNEIGSYRNSFFNQEIAESIFERLVNLYPERDFNSSLNVDHDFFENWKFVGVNPLFRTIKYQSHGSLIPHYDAPYIESNTKRTLVTLIIYLTTNETGKTRFIEDPQSNLSCYERNLEDWERKAKKSEVLLSIKPIAGNALIFDHRILHDSEELINEEKIILRTDLFFEKKYL